MKTKTNIKYNKNTIKLKIKRKIKSHENIHKIEIISEIDIK